MRKKLIVFIIIFTVFPVFLFSMTSFVVNYSRNEYKAGSQNWQIMQDDVTSWMYFANKMGILEFNGLNWNLYRFNNLSEGRSMLKSKKSNRLYIAGVNEFGYLTPDKIGRLTYQSIVSDAANNKLQVGNIWDIYEIDNAVYFCADNSIVKMVDTTLTVIPCPFKIDCSVTVGNTLYIGTNWGIYVLAGESLHFLPQSESLKNQKIRKILSFNGKILIASALNGLYLMDKNETIHFKTDVDDFLKSNELFTMAICDDKIALGTILKGIAIISTNGKLINYYNESHGLYNNTVLCNYFDTDNNLWLGLDNGISFINLESPITNLYMSPNFYGTGYAAAVYNNKLYLGTNQGLYSVDFPIPISAAATKLKLVDNMKGQVWSLKIVNNELICCLDRGLYVLNKHRIKSLDIKTGVWKFVPTLQNEHKAYISTYNGFYTMENNSETWQNPIHISEFVGSVYNFEEVEKGLLFIRNSWNEILRIGLNDLLTSVETTKLYNPPQIPTHSYIYKTPEGIKLCSSEGIYKFDTKNNMFVFDELLNKKLFNQKEFSYKYLSEVDSNIWALGDCVMTVYDAKKNKTTVQPHNLTLVGNFENMYPINDSLVVIPNENGFAIWNVDQTKSNKSDYKLQIIRVKTITPTDSSIYIHNFAEEKHIQEIAYKFNSLSFYFNLLDYDNNQNIYYRCKMDDEPWSDYSLSNFKDYSKLSVGTHTFTVEIQLADGNSLQTDYSFTILPPWYRTIWAFLIYCVLSIVLLYVIWYFDDLRIKRKKAQIIQKEREEMAMLEESYRKDAEKREQEIVQLKNEQLEMELKHKNQELANDAIHLARKNETLIDIKDDLNLISENIRKNTLEPALLRRNILTVKNKIEENIVLDDSLKKFEKHFDLVHNNFIQRLSEQYPSLTMNERKMCAFIKMQLSSKEIAPLLNISIRGVETLRYRLRKKFDLNREDSLTIFLNNFN